MFPSQVDRNDARFGRLLFMHCCETRCPKPTPHRTVFEPWLTIPQPSLVARWSRRNPVSEERSMPDEDPPETKVTDRLFATYISPDRKVLDMDSFKAAMVKALSDAYEQGLQDGLATKATGP